MTPIDIAEAIINHVSGSSKGILIGIDELIDDGKIDENVYFANEQQILSHVDNWVFECVVCGWTLEISELGEDTVGGELRCASCTEE